MAIPNDKRAPVPGRPNPAEIQAASSTTVYPSFGVADAPIIYRPPWSATASTSLVSDNTNIGLELPATISVAIPPSVLNPLFAHRQWRSGLILADAIARGEIDLRGKRVLELGAGTALPGITAALAGAKSTVITDYDSPDLVKRLRENVYANLPAVIRNDRGRVTVLGHTWGTDTEDVLYDPSVRGDNKFHAILCADLIWDALSHEVLLKTIGRVLAPGGVVYLSAGLHTGRDVLSHFFRLSEAVGLSVHGIDGEEQIYEWAVVGDGAELPVSQSVAGFGAVEGRDIRSDLSGERRPFEEDKLEDVKARNGWVVRCTLLSRSI
jgi:EEF1A N-terminal glycine/lysine methyltransferase